MYHSTLGLSVIKTKKADTHSGAQRVFPGDKVALDGKAVQWETLAIVDEDAR